MTDALPTDPPAPAKPGYRTTEFWLKVAAMVLTALFASGAIPTSGPAATITAIAATMLGALGYTVSRSLVKAAAALLVVGLLAAPQVACSSARSHGAVAAGAFIDCQTPNLVAALPDAIVLAKAAVMRWIAGDGAVDTAGLRSDASKMAGDLGKCAFDAAIAALAAPPPAQRVGAPAAAALAIDGPQLGARWAQVRGELGWAPEAAR